MPPLDLPTDVVPGTYVVTARSTDAPLREMIGTIVIDRPGAVRCALGTCSFTGAASP